MIKRADCMNVGMSLGLSPTEIMRDLTPGEMQDLLKLKSDKKERS